MPKPVPPALQSIPSPSLSTPTFAGTTPSASAVPMLSLSSSVVTPSLVASMPTQRVVVPPNSRVIVRDDARDVELWDTTKSQYVKYDRETAALWLRNSPGRFSLDRHKVPPELYPDLYEVVGGVPLPALPAPLPVQDLTEAASPASTVVMVNDPDEQVFYTTGSSLPIAPSPAPTMSSYNVLDTNAGSE